MANKIIVSNASPLMNLAIIGQLGLVRTLFETIIVPREVWEELTVAGQGKLGADEIANSKWIDVVTVENIDLFKLLAKDLDKGEAAAIAVAVERHADLVLLDETDARNVAEIYNLPKTGVIGILTRAKRQGLINAVKPLFDDLRYQAHFRLKQSLYERILKEMGEM